MRRSLSLLVALVFVCAVGALPVKADAAMAVIASRGQFIPGDNRNAIPVVVPHGYDVIFANLDPLSFGGHSMTSKDVGLFDSGILNAKQQTTVHTSDLASGTYGFYCVVHGAAMSGTLVVL